MFESGEREVLGNLDIRLLFIRLKNFPSFWNMNENNLEYENPTNNNDG